MREKSPWETGNATENIGYRHSTAGLMSKATFSWLTSLLWLGYANPLELEDLGRLPEEESTKKQFESFHGIYNNEKVAAKKAGRAASLWRCYFLNCWRLFSLGGFYKLLGDFVGFVGPFGISVIINYVARVQSEGGIVLSDGGFVPGSQIYYPTVADFFRNGYVMGVIIFLSALLQGTFSQSSTHLVNVEGIHLKGALQALVYDKSLCLSTWSIVDHKEDTSSISDESDDSGPLTTKSDHSRAGGSQGRNNFAADVGTITNLMSEDAFNVMSFFWIGHYVWAIPLKIVVLLYLLYLKLGWSAIIGAVFCILTMTPLQFLIGKKMSSNSKAITEMSDERLRKINEVLQGIKLLKLYGWECVYGSRMLETRQKELVLLDKDSLYWALMTFLTHASSVLITLVTFGVYFVLEGTVHSAANVFSGLALFNQLTVPLFIFPITVPIIISAMVSTKRLEEFLSLPETSRGTASQDGTTEPIMHADKVPLAEAKVKTLKQAELQTDIKDINLSERTDSVFGLGNIQEGEEDPLDDEEDAEDTEDTEPQAADDKSVMVSVDGGCFSWSSESIKPSLSLQSVELPRGKLTVVVGRVGSGKSSFLSALLGEMHMISGNVKWASDATVAYASQKAWLLNATLRENILFGELYRPRRYNSVVAACALQPDIDILPGKDLTEIGEKGINLSGGQKQRIAIARAMYSKANIVILDDPLSALDYQVGQQVFESGIKRLLLRQKRTVVLVTHRLQLLSHAHHILALERGAVRAQGSLKEIEAADAHLVQGWRAAMSREALEEKGTRGRTARERWQLVKLVSRIGVQLKQRNVSDGTWQTDEEAHVAPPTFVPLRKRFATFSGSRYFTHDLPLPIDECEAGFMDRPKRGRGSIKRCRTTTLSYSGQRPHKVVLRASSLQTSSINENTPYPVTRQFSSPTIRHEPPLASTCRARTYTLNDVPQQESLLKRILSIQSQRSVIAASDLPNNNTKEKNRLRRLMSSSSKGVIAAVENTRLPVKRLPSAASTFSDDMNDDDDDDDVDDDEESNRGRLVSEEEREYGKISKRIYIEYLCACGVMAGLLYLISAVVWQGLRVYTDYWLSEWTNSDNAIAPADSKEEMFKYCLRYTILSVTSIILSFLSNGIGQYAGAKARRTLHNKMLYNILRCPLLFFETTPVGRIINRFSTDMGVIDKKIATSIQRLLQFLLLCFSAIIVNAVVTPWFLCVAIPICIIYYMVQRFYRCSSRELQRLDSITRSPIFSHFSETLAGLPVIRAFNHQKRFTDLLIHKMDAHNNAFLIMNSSNRWLGIALDYLGGVIVFLAIVAALVSVSLLPAGVITPSLVGLAVNYTLLVPIYLNWVVKFLADMEMYMGAVERVRHYATAPIEEYRLQGITVPKNWPQKGDIVFEGVSVRYNSTRDPVITNLNLHIPAGQKVGICGRTGSGKSSLVMSLFHMVDVFEGSILIDGINTKLVPLQVLRSRLSIIPQDVIMFSGTIRENLDPVSQYSDTELWSSLELAQLKEVVNSHPGGLDAEVREGGENLSAGERQLFCLARAILHNAACLVMDEATSSVDPSTEKALLAAATKAFNGRTVISIAHRLPTILDCDRILVLDGGHIVEDGTPSQLLHRSMGIFTSMLRASEEGTLTA